MFYAPAFGILFGCSPIGLACTQGVYVYTYIYVFWHLRDGMGWDVVLSPPANPTKPKQTETEPGNRELTATD